MDRRSMAYLDKSRLSVKCGSCGKQIASIHESFGAFVVSPVQVQGPDRIRRVILEDEPDSSDRHSSDTTIYVKEYHTEVKGGIGQVYTVGRVLVIDWGHRLYPDGIWKLNARSARRLQQGKHPTVRRQRKVDNFYDLAMPIRTSDPVYPGQNSKDFNRDNPGEDLQLPAKIQCPYCLSVQTLDANKLEVVSETCYLGSDVRQWQQHYWSKEELRARYPDDNPYKIVRRKVEE